jgi:hypothetical protein
MFSDSRQHLRRILFPLSIAEHPVPLPCHVSRASVAVGSEVDARTFAEKSKMWAEKPITRGELVLYLCSAAVGILLALGFVLIIGLIESRR